MRVVLDTNVIVSAIFWHSKPHSILELIRSQQLEGWTSEALLAELLEVLSRNKFSSRLAVIGTSPQDIVEGLRALLQVVVVDDVARVVESDPDDDYVIACATAAQVDCIISGDTDLLTLKTHAGIPILSAAEFLEQLPGTP